MRPGNNNIEGTIQPITQGSNKEVDKKAQSDTSNFNEEMKQYAKLEEKRFRTMLDLCIKFRDFEDERLKI